MRQRPIEQARHQAFQQVAGPCKAWPTPDPRAVPDAEDGTGAHSAAEDNLLTPRRGAVTMTPLSHRRSRLLTSVRCLMGVIVSLMP